MVNYNISRGGISNMSYLLGKKDKITGFGLRNSNRIKKPYRGGADAEAIEINEALDVPSKREYIQEPKRTRGRPPKTTQPKEEEQDIEPKNRGRNPRSFQSNITDTLNQALQDLRTEEMQIKKYEYDADIRKMQIKQLKKVEKDLTKIYLKCI